MITRDELNELKINSPLLEIIQSAEEFGVIDGRKERQEANTIALRKVLTDYGLEVEGMGFGDILYELRKIMKDRASKEQRQNTIPQW